MNDEVMYYMSSLIFKPISDCIYPYISIIVFGIFPIFLEPFLSAVYMLSGT
jgi:sterol desaturase/sphingolipid hydroxylase (fatty acid hydroxylase superfamily)